MYMSAALLGNETAKKIDADARRSPDVVHVLGGQRRCRKAAALAVDSLVVGEFAAVADDGEDLAADDPFDVEDDATIVEQEDTAGGDVPRQILVIEPHAFTIAQLAARVEDEARALFEPDLAFGELADADFRALQVGENTHRPLHAGRHFAHQCAPCDVVVGLPCEKLRRTTSTPARIIRSRTSLLDDAGPRVATILVSRDMFFLFLLCAAASGAPGAPLTRQRAITRTISSTLQE
jgi:hypothetical protein